MQVNPDFEVVGEIRGASYIRADSCLQLRRIRLIGRLFFKLGGRRLNLRSPFCILFVQVVA